MKKTVQKISFISALILTISISVNAQTISTFETLNLLPNSYWNGANDPMGTTFSSGNAILQNFYDTSWGGFWTGGFAYSNVFDTTTAGSGNLYAARPGSGYSSSNYVIGQQNAMIELSGVAAGKAVSGFYISNTTFAAISMRDGDTYAKKFGGTTGNDPDFFKLTIRKYYQGILANDSIEFYLADYRFSNNTQDYIVTNWRWVDLTSLGNTDSLKFILSSSDMGLYGINTPLFYCIDNFTTTDTPTNIAQERTTKNTTFSLYPNPVVDEIIINSNQSASTIEILDFKGSVVYKKENTESQIRVSVAAFPQGIYFVRINNDNTFEMKSFIKQ